MTDVNFEELVEKFKALYYKYIGDDSFDVVSRKIETLDGYTIHKRVNGKLSWKKAELVTLCKKYKISTPDCDELIKMGLALAEARQNPKQTTHIINTYQTSGGAWSEAEYQAALDRYLEWLSAATNRVVLRGIERGGKQAVELPLHKIYLPLAAETLPEAREQLKQGMVDRLFSRKGEIVETAETTRRISMQQLLTQGGKLAVIGTPGCGKTTVLSHIA